MEWVASADAVTAERAAAQFIAARLAQATEIRGQATLAISGGRSPWAMLDRLAEQAVPWNTVHLFQVDERCVPRAHPDRNWGRFLSGKLAQRVPRAQQHPLPVELEDLELAADEYARTLIKIAGDPPALDVVHLGLGADGHTASLFAGDPLLDERRRWVGVSQPYQSQQRLSLTLPTLEQARNIVWFATGSPRRQVLNRLFVQDPAIPASRVRRERASVFTDRETLPGPQYS
jgi:6-phosphogluconolactonase